MDDLIRTLKERRARLTQDWRAFIDTAEERNQWDAQAEERDKKYQNELVALEERIHELETHRSWTKNADETREAYESFVSPDAGNRTDTRVNDFFEGRTDNLTVDLEFRDLQTDTGSGANVVPTSFSRQLISYLVEESTILGLARVLNVGPGSSIEVPRLTSYGTAVNLTGEGSALTEADPTLAEVTLAPFKYGGITQTTFELNSASGVDIRDMIARDHATQIGTAVGYDLAHGSGSNAPRGLFVAIANDAGTAVQVSSALSDPDHLVDLMMSVAPGYQRGGFWLMRQSTLAEVRKFKDGNQNYILNVNSGLQPGAPAEIMGRPVAVDGQIDALGSANLSVGFGAVDRAYTVAASNIRFEFSDDYAFNQDLRTWRSAISVDADVVDSNAFAVLDTDA